MKKPIIILGMHRSGTSLLAEVINHWGAYGGKFDELMPADDANQRGYWEYMPLVRFNEVLLASEDAIWFVPPYNDEIFYEKARDQQFKKAASDLIDSMENNSHIWYWKDPRLAILLSFWQQLWREAVYIISIRHPMDIALSIKKRNNFPISASLLLWQYYLLSILKHTEGRPNIMFISYERFLNDPESQCRRLCSFLDKIYEVKTDPSFRIESMQSVVAPSQNHHRSAEPFSSFSVSTPEQIALYAFLEKKIKNPAERYTPEGFPMYRGWREFLLTINALIKVSSINK